MKQSKMVQAMLETEMDVAQIEEFRALCDTHTQNLLSKLEEMSDLEKTAFAVAMMRFGEEIEE